MEEEKAPKPPLRWDGIFEAIYRVKCPQPDGSGVENCLVVNVFTPEHAKLLPVVVHVHDGEFQRGWGSHNVPMRLLRQGFVVITFNYRLGPLGFLCLRTAGIPGNAGLKDQIAALYWVHRNIARFGGNPQHVTLYGTGSGGVSVELLLLSELTINLVHRAIIESGTVLSPSSLSYDPFELALAEAYKLGFKGGSDRDLEIFYNKIPSYSLVNSSGIFLPCVENSILSNSFLEQDPIDILKHGIYQHVPLLFSYSYADEISLIYEDIKKFNTTPEDFAYMLPSNLAFETDDLKQKIAALTKDFYFDGFELSGSVIQNYIDYVNDIFMEYPITKSTTLHAVKSTQPVYLMKFIHKGGLSISKVGAIHGDISKYIFAAEDLEEDDERTAERLLTLWSNFVKLGDPTPLTTHIIPVIWQPVLPQDIDGRSNIGKVSYLQFGRDMVNKEPEGQQLTYWDYIYEKYYRNHV